MNKKLKRILQKNKEMEKDSPFNFCDRWCERCTFDKQARCKVYHYEFEQKITCIAHGKNPDDSQMREEVMKKQFEDVEELLEEYRGELDSDVCDIDDPDLEEIKEHVKTAKNHPLPETADIYRKKANDFLENAFLKNKKAQSSLNYHFETIAWYHTLILAKLNRAFSGLEEIEDDEEFCLCDAVAQFEICKKGVTESVKAFKKIIPYFAGFRRQILELLSLLHNIYSRINIIENNI